MCFLSNGQWSVIDSDNYCYIALLYLCWQIRNMRTVNPLMILLMLTDEQNIHELQIVVEMLENRWRKCCLQVYVVFFIRKVRLLPKWLISRQIVKWIKSNQRKQQTGLHYNRFICFVRAISTVTVRHQKHHLDCKKLLQTRWEPQAWKCS